MRRIVVGMTGATGAVLGVEVLRRLQGCPDVQTHLVLSRWARATIQLESDRKRCPERRAWRHPALSAARSPLSGDENDHFGSNYC
jgi:3-polyprenyl-4-hydroxybenzoate decarboxylase